MAMCRSRWPRGVRRGSAAVRLLGLRVRIPPSTVCLSGISKPKKCGSLGPPGLWSHKKITVMCLNYTKDVHSKPRLKMSNPIFSWFRMFISRQSQGVRVTTDAMDKQQRIPCVLLNYMSLSTIQKYWLNKYAFMANLCRRQHNVLWSSHKVPAILLFDFKPNTEFQDRLP
jgi:hypothetical protein